MTSATDTALSTELRDARIAAGLTQEQLAVLADCSAGSIRGFEQGYEPTRRSRALEGVRTALADLKAKDGLDDSRDAP